MSYLNQHIPGESGIKNLKNIVPHLPKLHAAVKHVEKTSDGVSLNEILKPAFIFIACMVHY